MLTFPASFPFVVTVIVPTKMFLVEFTKFPMTLLVANNCETLIASVDVLVICPAATFLNYLSLPTEPINTTEIGLFSANPLYFNTPTITSFNDF